MRSELSYLPFILCYNAVLHRYAHFRAKYLTWFHSGENGDDYIWVLCKYTITYPTLPQPKPYPSKPLPSLSYPKPRYMYKPLCGAWCTANCVRWQMIAQWVLIPWNSMRFYTVVYFKVVHVWGPLPCPSPLDIRGSLECRNPVTKQWRCDANFGWGISPLAKSKGWYYNFWWVLWSSWSSQTSNFVPNPSHQPLP